MNRRLRVETAAKGWRSALVDPSGRNRLLYYRDLKVGTLDLSGASSKPLDRLLNGKPGAKVRLSRLFPESKKAAPDAEPTIEDAVKRARAVSRKALENFEERGVHTLFLAQGFATWSPKTSRALPAAPVLICAAGLHRLGASEVDFELTLDGEWMVNEALLQHLATEFKVEISGESLLGSKLSDARLDNDEVEEIIGDLQVRAGEVPGFDVDSGRLVIGNFMYKKLPMVNDILSNVDALVQHDLIAALAGDEESLAELRRSQTVVVDPSQPDNVPPADEYLVLDADSTQNQAINAALGGESFVLQGPPGTGKSQTISNLIATMMARGKSVLFVAEKRAAIDAVTKRLTQVGLDDFVMDLHGGRMGRRKMARELARTLTAISTTPPADHQDLHRRIETRRNELSSYARALHESRPPWGLSLYEVQNRLRKVANERNQSDAGVPGSRRRLRISSKTVHRLDSEKFRKLRGDLERWADLSSPFQGPRPTLWKDARITVPEEVERADRLVCDIIEVLLDIEGAIEDLLDNPCVPDPGSLDNWISLLDLLNEFNLAGERPDAEPLNDRFQQLGRNLTRLIEKEEDVKGRVAVATQAVVDHKWSMSIKQAEYHRGLEELEAECQKGIRLEEDLHWAEKGGWRLFSARLLKASFRAARRQAAGLNPGQAELSDLELLELARRRTTQTRLFLEGRQEEVDLWEKGALRQHELLEGERYSIVGMEKQIEQERQGLELAKATTFDQREQMTREINEWDDRQDDRRRRWQELGGRTLPQIPFPLSVSEAKSPFARLANLLEEMESILPGHRMIQNTHERVTAWVVALERDLHLVNRMPELSELERSITDVGLESLLDMVRKGMVRPSHVAAELDYAWLTAIRNRALQTDRQLGSFSTSRQNRLVTGFRRNDADHIQGTPHRVRRRAAEHAVKVCNRFPTQDDLVRREANKKTRHLPLRRLFEAAPDVLKAVRPCWAMSPLDVAESLPPRSMFDLIIFDEASQVLPCDAISALLRGRRAVVAGDSRQLPPTIFFDSASADDAEDGYDSQSLALSDYESILDLMEAILSRRPITWHYRSRDERLVAFSNRNIYHGSLTTFPGAVADESLRFELVEHLPGQISDTRSNPREVERVVELMIQHARERPQESLGVIAMGRYHSDRIEEALRRRLREEPSEDLEQFFWEEAEERAFVKNLERVQGDERDAIILSIGYGKNASGRLMYRFGPLNMEGGERRLNVAVTRARHRMTLVSSFSHAEMDPGRTSAEGVKKLRGYLKYVETGGREIIGDEGLQPLNAFELDVHDKLTDAGLDVVPQYGCSGYRIDFPVRHPRHPDQFVLAVEADGASYHSSHTARDRDRLRQQHLENLGWRFCRIWSTSWFNDHRKEVNRVVAEYRRVLEEETAPPSARQVEASPEAPRSTVHEPPSRTGHHTITPGLPISEYRSAQLEQLARWVMSDGRLRTDDQIFEEMFLVLGYGRRGARIKEALYKAIAEAKRHDGL